KSYHDQRLLWFWNAHGQRQCGHGSHRHKRDEWRYHTQCRSAGTYNSSGTRQFHQCHSQCHRQLLWFRRYALRHFQWHDFWTECRSFASRHLTDNSTWTLNSTGNQWTNSTVASGRFIMGGNNVLPANVVVRMGQGGSTGILDLNGFNQQIVGLVDGGGIEIIASSSTTADATLTL